MASKTSETVFIWATAVAGTVVVVFGVGFYVGREQAPYQDPSPPRPPDINIHVPATVTSIDGPLVRLSGGCEPARVVLEGGTFEMNNGPAISLDGAGRTDGE